MGIITLKSFKEKLWHLNTTLKDQMLATPDWHRSQTKDWSYSHVALHALKMVALNSVGVVTYMLEHG
jgi:hypothetical protein